MRICKIRFRRIDLQDAMHYTCLLLFNIVAILVVYRHFWQDSRDVDKCDALLTRGRWLDAPNPYHSVKAHRNWQPAGCMMHKYEAGDITGCLRSRRVVFIGDSIVRQIFWAFAKKLDIQEQVANKHSSVSVAAHGLKVEFVWDPYLNGSNLVQEVAAEPLSGPTNDQIDAAAILLIGGGLWNLRYLGGASYWRYESSIREITRALKYGKTPQTRSSNDLQSSKGEDDLVVLAPIQVPNYDALSPERASTITPARVVPIFQYLQQSSVPLNITIAWSFSDMTWRESSAYSQDGLHVTGVVASEMADVLLNARCNAFLRRSSSTGFPMDKTCCNSYPKPDWTQSIILTVSLGLLPALIPITSKDAKRFGFIPSRKVVRAIAVLALAICYCYFADRTQLFNKVQKQYSFTEFSWLCMATLILGALSLRRSAPAPLYQETGCATQKVQSQPILSRSQTDEWKGWMQFIILIYHYTGASRVLCIYETIRLLVASYIFMTGFGHTVFFYQRSDYSLRRSAAVLIRTNMLSCLLPYIMKTNYLYYYFAPLISFWYSVIYLTMAVGHSRNRSWGFLMAKFFVSAAFTTALIRAPGVFETLFRALEKCFNIHWSVTEWRFRLQLDCYVIYAGMLSGAFFANLMNTAHGDTPEGNVSVRLCRQVLPILRLAGPVTAAVTLLVFYHFARHAPDKYAYNAWFPYISTAPVLAYVVFRNINHQTRSFHSLLFVWMGQHSLETFTLQFHIWLGADTTGLLSLGVFEPIVGGKCARRLDLAILTIIFLWVCWHVAAATQTLTGWIVGPSERTETTKQDTRLTGMEGLPVLTGAGAKRLDSWMKWHDAGGLRARIGIILVCLWILNMLSAQSSRRTI